MDRMEGVPDDPFEPPPIRADKIDAIAEAADRLERMRDALANIWIWAESDARSGETRQKAMADIAGACRKALEY